MSFVSRRTVLKVLAAPMYLPVSIAGQVMAHREPKPLDPNAVTHNWSSFLGPTFNAVSTETKLSRTLPAPVVWEFPTGSGYASPVILNDRLVYIHRVGDEEVIECLHSETGSVHWRYRYSTVYEDRYGYNNGPRSSPVVDEIGGRVYTVGAEGKLHAIELDSGRVIWRKELRQDYRVSQDFFGTASTPLIEGDALIVNVGAPGGPTVVAFALETGDELWRAGTEWGASYASPIPATIHGQRRIFVFAGGESQPPSGGLLVLDPADGAIDFEFPWRSRTFESVNASCPVVFNNQVFISASYRAGGALLSISPNFEYTLDWTTPDFALHFNTPIYRDGYLYGFDGRNMGDASLACLDAANGTIVWRATPEWTESFELNGRVQERLMGTARGSLLAADGDFLCLGELGHLLWLRLGPGGFEEISRTWLFAARECWNLPVLSHGLLYISQNTRDLLTGSEPRLLCYDLRA